MTDISKRFISAGSLLKDSYRLAKQVYDSGFRPDFLAALWRGGAPIGMAVEEYFEFLGQKPDHVAIKTSSYTGVGQREKTVKVFNLEYFSGKTGSDSSLLIVDDVYGTGNSIKAVIGAMRSSLGQTAPGDIRVATVYHNPSLSQTGESPDYLVRRTSDWLVFPHDLEGLTMAEITGSKERHVRDFFRNSHL